MKQQTNYQLFLSKSHRGRQKADISWYQLISAFGGQTDGWQIADFKFSSCISSGCMPCRRASLLRLSPRKSSPRTATRLGLRGPTKPRTTCARKNQQLVQDIFSSRSDGLRRESLWEFCCEKSIMGATVRVTVRVLLQYNSCDNYTCSYQWHTHTHTPWHVLSVCSHCSYVN